VPGLPLYDATQPRERADAARNRRRVLAAATELVAERGIEHVSMEDVARAACVGTGTLYRRFGGRAELALALLDDQTRAFQEAILRGPPPLGPGAPASERLRAVGHGFIELVERHADVLMVAAAPGRDGGGPHQFYATHLTILLRELAPHLDAEYTAQALLAALGPAQHTRLRRGADWPLERLREGWDGLIGALSSS